MSARLRVTAVAAAAVLPLAVAAARPAAAMASDDLAKSYTVALVGDDNYAPLADQPGGLDKSDRMIAAINAAGVAFSVHDGDIKSGSTECRRSIVDATQRQFGTYTHPLVYLFGDNEWTDCHRFAQGSGDPDFAQVPMDRLDVLREQFYPTAASQGANQLTLTRQADVDPRFGTYVENVRWQQGPVVFVGIDQPGSNNNFCSPRQTNAVCGSGAGNPQQYEATRRNFANLAWIRDGFRYAEKHGGAAVIIVAQSDPNFANIQDAAHDFPTYDDNGFDAFLTTLRDETQRFDGQVVFVHGDSHAISFDHPLTDACDPRDPKQVAAAKPLANFTRIETFGNPDTHWVKMTVNPHGDTLLTFEPELVPGNPHPVNAEVPPPLRLPRLKMDDGLRWGLPEFVDAILSGVFPLSTICLPVPLK
jgi:hypothetical protein